MKFSSLWPLLLAFGSLFVLAACVGTESGNSALVNKYSTSCMFEVNAPGSYVWSDNDAALKPGGGGTAEGAAALNACIQKKAAAAGDTVATAKAAQSRQVVEVEQSGTQVTKTYTYGQPPAQDPSRMSQGGEEKCRQRNVFSGGTGYYGCVR